jgi:hypothetical protein
MVRTLIDSKETVFVQAPYLILTVYPVLSVSTTSTQRT